MKRTAKKLIKKVYKRSHRLLPSTIQTELDGYLEYRNERETLKSASLRLPYWERREKKGIVRPTVRIGFVGAGRYAQHHLRVLSNLSHVELSAMLTTGSARAQEAATKYGIKRVLSDAGAFFSLHDVDAFVVVVPVQFLKSIALQALNTGRPVLMEKPPGINSKDTAELVDCAKRNATFGMVCMNRRFYSVLEHGLAALANCGPIRGVMAEIPQQITAERQSQRLSEFVYENFYIANSIHSVDLVRYVLGDPIDVHSLATLNRARKNAGASLASILEYPNGVVATITDLWDTPEVWRMKIVAEMGWLEFQGLERGWFFNAEGEKAQIRPDPVDTEFRTGIYAQDLDFIEAVRSGNPPFLPACLLPDAYKTMVVMEHIMSDSIRSARAVPVP